MSTNNKKPLYAWHFLPSMNPDGTGNLSNGDPRKVRPGRKLVHRGELKVCSSGLHASESALDAMLFRKGPVVTRVRISGRVCRSEPDKLACTVRTALWVADASPVLRAFARRVALDVADRWEMPAVAREYLETGDESKREAAFAAATTAYSSSAAAAAYDGVAYASAATSAAAAAYAASAAIPAAYAASAAYSAYAAYAARFATTTTAARVAARAKYAAWLEEALWTLAPEEARGLEGAQ